MDCQSENVRLLEDHDVLKEKENTLVNLFSILPSDLDHLRCTKLGHFSSVSNIVCVQKDCSDRGLICVYCLTSICHAGHQIIGVEQFLASAMQFRGSEFRHDRRIRALKHTLAQRYTCLQMRIAELTQSLEILTHQVKHRYEADLARLQTSSQTLRKLQETFIRSSASDYQREESSSPASPEPSRGDTIKQFVYASLRCISYSYDDSTCIRMQGFDESLTRLDHFEQRFDGIQALVEESITQIQRISEDISSPVSSDDGDLLATGLGDLLTLKDSQGTGLSRGIFSVHSISLVDSHSHRISGLVLLNENDLYSSSHDGFIRQWNIRDQRCVRVLRSAFSRIWLALTHLPHLSCLAALSSDNTLHLINASTLKVFRRIVIPSAHTSCPLIIKVPGRPSEVAVASGSRVFFIDVVKEAVTYTAESKGYYVYSFDIWSDGRYKYIIYGDKQGRLYASETTTKTDMRCIENAHGDKIVDVRVLPNTNYIITASTDKQIKVWKMPLMQEVGVWESKGFVDGFSVAGEQLLIVKEHDDDKLHVIYQDDKEECKKKPFLTVRPTAEGVFLVANLPRAVVTTSLIDSRDAFPKADIHVDFF